MATKAELTASLAKVYASIDQINDSGQSVSADGRSLTMADLGALRETADWLEGKIKRMTGGRNRTIQVTPHA